MYLNEVVDDLFFVIVWFAVVMLYLAHGRDQGEGFAINLAPELVLDIQAIQYTLNCHTVLVPLVLV